MKIFAHISWFFATLIIFSSLAFLILIFHLVPEPYAPKISSWIIRISIFFSTDVRGEEHPDTQMFLINHQSDLDIAVMETVSKKNLAWVAKKELFEIPFFGLSLKWPQDIAVERQSKTSIIKLLKDVKHRLSIGKTITMFPEGTRSSKEKMLPFKSGAKIVADKLQLRVQPVVFMQTSKHYNIKEFYYKPGRIKVFFLESFIADKNDPEWLNNLRVKMQKVYDDELINNPSHR